MTTGQDQRTCTLEANQRPLVEWALAALTIRWEPAGESTIRIWIPLADRDRFGGRELIEIAFVEPDGSMGDGADRSASDAFWDWMAYRLRSREDVFQIVASEQPSRVHRLTERLFQTYTVDGGAVRLAGCSLEDRPLLRATWWVRPADGAGGGAIAHTFSDAEGQPLDAPVRAMLADELLTEPCTPPLALPPQQLAKWRGNALAAGQADGSTADRELVCVAVVWCKYATGKLRFVIGGHRAELAFAEWAKLMADGTIGPPLFRCPLTGRESYHLAATDDGTITAAEAIATCDVTGRRVLETELETSRWSGRRATAENVVICPVTGDRLLVDETVACGNCQQTVSPAAIRRGRCVVCRSLRSVSRDDPRVARLLGEFPKLDDWGRWHAGESHRVFVLTAVSWLRRLLLVVDKETLEVSRVALAGRWSSRWSEATELERRELIGD